MVSDPRKSHTVSIAAGIDGYGEAPFSPSAAWPEYAFGPAALGATDNPAYAGVREALRLLGLDEARFGTADWNPLGAIIRPGETAVLKPNFVRDFRESSPDHANCLITHGAVIRAVLDYVYLALDGRGRVLIADAPQNDADFSAIRRIAGLDAIQAFYRKHAAFDVEVYDLRPEAARKIDGVIVGHEPLPGDPAGYVKVNLGARSAFVDVNPLCHLLYGSEYDTREVRSHHHDEVHEYLISQTILDADCVVSLPKLKTHKKVGLTVNLKNLVGINGNKNWLPHHREGTPAEGGDQFADNGAVHRIERRAVAAFKRLFPYLGPLRRRVAGPIKAAGKQIFGDTNTDTIRSGNWYGNDTTWRMVLDLNRILFYADAAGAVHEQPVRRFFSVVDAIVAGEGNGPLDAMPKAAGLVLAGGNPAAVDRVCAALMGFDGERLPMIQQAFARHALPLIAFGMEAIAIRSNETRFVESVAAAENAHLGFRPHFGWRGHVECRPTACE